VLCGEPPHLGHLLYIELPAQKITIISPFQGQQNGFRHPGINAPFRKAQVTAYHCFTRQPDHNFIESHHIRAPVNNA
jgi:hypothetical protein